MITWTDIRRSHFPSLRRPGPVGIVRNGGIKRVYECALCGATDSMDARWRIPVHVRDFIADHGTSSHMIEWMSRRPDAAVGFEGVALVQMEVQS